MFEYIYATTDIHILLKFLIILYCRTKIDMQNGAMLFKSVHCLLLGLLQTISALCI